MHSAPIKLTPSCTRATELQVEPDESCHRALPPPQASLTPQHAQKMRRGEIIRDLAITASLSRSGAIKLQGGGSLCSIPSGSTSQLFDKSFSAD